jgi:hypothetical protein
MSDMSLFFGRTIELSVNTTSKQWTNRHFKQSGTRIRRRIRNTKAARVVRESLRSRGTQPNNSRENKNQEKQHG